MPTKLGLLVMAFALAACTTPFQGPPPSLAFALQLHCAGARLAPAAKGAPPVVSPVGAGGVDDEVLVEIAGNQGRIRIPHVLSGGDADWITISALEIGDRRIGGHFWMKPWDQSSISIDRMTGRIELVDFRGVGFRGTCLAYDQNEAPKF